MSTTIKRVRVFSPPRIEPEIWLKIWKKNYFKNFNYPIRKIGSIFNSSWNSSSKEIFLVYKFFKLKCWLNSSWNSSSSSKEIFLVYKFFKLKCRLKLEYYPGSTETHPLQRRETIAILEVLPPRVECYGIVNHEKEERRRKKVSSENPGT